MAGSGRELNGEHQMRDPSGVSWGIPPPRNSKSKGKGLIKMLGTAIIAILLKTFPLTSVPNEG